MEQTGFDAIVIGAGQAGNPLCRALAGAGWRVALVERRLVGGVCTNDGCTPTKVMAAVARTVYEARRAARFGLESTPYAVNLRAVHSYTQGMVTANRKVLERTLVEQESLELVYGEASFAAGQPEGEEHAVEVRLRGGGVRTLRSARVFVDVGERPAVPQVEGLGSVPYLDSSRILELDELPRHLLILGGGYIAVEFAQMFRRFGAAVTLLERGAQLLAREDEDIAACLTGILREDGVDVLLEAEVQQVTEGESGIDLLFTQGGEKRSVSGSHLLVATGRVPNTEALRCERVGLEPDEHGYLRVDERLRTAVPGIWATGDVTGGPPYTHIAYDDFRVLRSQLLEDGARVTTGRQVPYCIFTDPELGRVGMTEREARATGLPIRVAHAEMKVVARAREMGETRGMMKAVVDSATGKLLGASILGVNGGDVATQLQIAMMGGLSYRDLREGIFTHPVLAEELHVLFRDLRE